MLPPKKKKENIALSETRMNTEDKHLLTELTIHGYKLFIKKHLLERAGFMLMTD